MNIRKHGHAGHRWPVLEGLLGTLAATPALAQDIELYEHSDQSLHDRRSWVRPR